MKVTVVRDADGIIGVYSGNIQSAEKKILNDTDLESLDDADDVNIGIDEFEVI